MYPKIKFRINENKDFETLKAFTGDALFDGGENLKWAIFRKYPTLKKFFNVNVISDIKSLRSFIGKKYNYNSNRIKNNLNIYERNWGEIEKPFFELTDDLFNERRWPKGKYIAYPTIWGMYPRFLEDKTFQIPHKRRNKKYVNVVIAHEMLHFMFYDYFYEKYPKYKSEKYNYFVWNVSEIFNEIIQNSPPWLRIFKEKTMGYPNHEKIVKKLVTKYCKEGIFNVDILTSEVIIEVRFLLLDK